MSGFSDRTVVVTGANGALGIEVVSRLVSAGSRVAIITRGAPAPQIASLPGVSGYRADLTDSGATTDAARQIVAEHGGVDGLLHLVGGWRGGVPIEEADPADWEFLEAGLIRSLQRVTQAFYPALRASADARFAVISSTVVAKPTASNAMYAAAKAAVEAWTLAVAEGFSGSNAAAVILRVKALLTPKMVQDAPERKFPGYTTIGDVAERLLALWDVPAGEVNGTVITLVPGESD